MPPNLSNRSRVARSVFVLPPTLLKALYPPRCAGCDAFCETLFCAPCRASLQNAPPLFGVEAPREYSLVVPERERANAATLETRAALLFDGALREAIHRFKYEGRIALAAPLAQLMLETLRAAEKETASTRGFFSGGVSPDQTPRAATHQDATHQDAAELCPEVPRAIHAATRNALEKRAKERASTRAIFHKEAAPIFVAVPLHAWRRWRRGYNQSELLARELAHLWNAPCLSLLRRTRYTVTQTELSHSQRLENVRGAFALNENATRVLATQSTREIILIDDVYTTGATLQEAARVLRAALPAAKISALTLAYSPPH